MSPIVIQWINLGLSCIIALALVIRLLISIPLVKTQKEIIESMKSYIEMFDIKKLREVFEIQIESIRTTSAEEKKIIEIKFTEELESLKKDHQTTFEVLQEVSEQTALLLVFYMPKEQRVGYIKKNFPQLEKSFLLLLRKLELQQEPEGIDRSVLTKIRAGLDSVSVKITTTQSKYVSKLK